MYHHQESAQQFDIGWLAKPYAEFSAHFIHAPRSEANRLTEWIEDIDRKVIPIQKPEFVANFQAGIRDV